MNKREFIKTTLAAGAGMAMVGSAAGSMPSRKKQSKSVKHWVWELAKDELAEAELREKFKKYKEAGICGVFFETDSEVQFRAAKRAGLEVHRWMWTMNRGQDNLLQEDPEYFAINRLGESCAEVPPYVDYYRWLCPSKPEVRVFLENQVKQILANKYVDGIHLDYVRYPDVILPVKLWGKYGIEQNREMAAYDYCYCETCRSDYKAKTGKDPLELEYPDQSASWRKFRYNKLNEIVNRLSGLAAVSKKSISAAVFPTPEVAKRLVRQDWGSWELDAVFPMIYHDFYGERLSWIGDAVEEGMNSLHGRYPLYAGLFLPDLKSEHDLKQAIKLAMDKGAMGVSFFGEVDEQVLAILKGFGDKNE